MSGEEQKLLELEKDLPVLKEKYRQTLESFLLLCEKRSKIGERRSAFWACHEAAIAFFNAHDKAICNGALLKADTNPTWYTERAETAANVLESICIFYETIYARAPDVKVEISLLKPSLTSFAAMQRLVKQNLPQLARTLRERFLASDLPTHGFDTDELSKQTGGIEPRFFVVGVLSLVFALGMVVWGFGLGNLTRDQRFLFLWMLPIAGGFASGSFTGSLSAASKRWKNTLIVAATGGFAVWVLTYLMLWQALPKE